MSRELTVAVWLLRQHQRSSPPPREAHVIRLRAMESRRREERLARHGRSLRRQVERGLIFSLVAIIMFASLLSGFSGTASAIQATSKVSQPAPILGQLPDIAHPDALTVVGAHFTPGGKVYVAIYDQAGQRLYENRWVHASLTLSADEAAIWSDRYHEEVLPSPGGAIHETFNGLCGAMAMVRALDNSTSRWTNWLTIEPNCAPTNAAEIADGLDSTLKLPVKNVPESSFAISQIVSAPGHEVIPFDPPLLLQVASEPERSDVVTVTGFGFTAGQRVYVAVYDQMGAKIYGNRWLTATTEYQVVDPTATDPGTRVVKTTNGYIHFSFNGLCGANVMIRAYDATTQMWSNFITTTRHCFTDPYGGPGGGASANASANGSDPCVISADHGCGNPDEH